MTSHIQEIISVSNEIYDKGLVFGKSGNISKRIKSSIGDIVTITPTLTSLSDLKPEDVVLVDMQGNALTNGTPSSEVNMHLKIYAKRPDVNAIVHTHSAYATGFAYTDKRIKRVEGFKKIKNDPYLHFIEYEKPGSEELAINASENIENDDVLILKNHGVICVGYNLNEAKLLAFFVEETAKTQFAACMLNSAEDI